MSIKEVKLLEGKIPAAKIQADIKNTLEDFRAKKMDPPRLAALQAGQNPASEWYLNQQEKLASKLGILFDKLTVPAESQKLLEERIKQLNDDAECHGVFITMPLPKGLNPDNALLALDSRKDVEGIHPASLGLLVLRRAKLIPPTAFAALALIEFAIAQSEGEALKGKKAVIVGQSAIVGRPLQMLLGERRVTTTVCNTGTKPQDLEEAVRQSDIVVACAGQPGLIKGAWIKPGAIVIDVGTTEVGGKLAGDVEFEEARKRAGFITPVPGGVGPLTVTMLMQNLMTAYKWQKGLWI